MAATAAAVGGNGTGILGDDVVFYSPEKRRETLVMAATNEDDSHASFSNVGEPAETAGAVAWRRPPLRRTRRSRRVERI